MTSETTQAADGALGEAIERVDRAMFDYRGVLGTSYPPVVDHDLRLILAAARRFAAFDVAHTVWQPTMTPKILCLEFATEEAARAALDTVP